MYKSFTLNLLLFAAAMAAYGLASAGAQSVPPSVTQPPTAPPPSPVITTPVAATPTPPVIPVTPPPGVFTPDIVVPTDVTNLDVVHGPFELKPGTAAMRGIKSVDGASFPDGDDLDDNGEGMVVWTDDATQYKRTSPCSLSVDKGQVLVSVRKPSHLALVATPLGEIAISSGSDVLISVGNPFMRVMNLDGRGESVRLKLNKGPFRGSDVKSVAVAAGFEVIAATEKLTRLELRPSDGFARRYHTVLDKGYLAIQEFSVESVLNSSGLIAQMTQELSGKKIDRIIGDMSKMAAVLNYMNGSQGFVASSSGNIEN